MTLPPEIASISTSFGPGGFERSLRDIVDPEATRIAAELLAELKRGIASGDAGTRVARTCEDAFAWLRNGIDARLSVTGTPLGLLVSRSRRVGTGAEARVFRAFLGDYLRLAALRGVPLLHLYEDISGGVAVALAYAILEQRPLVEVFAVTGMPITDPRFLAAWGDEVFALVPTATMRRPNDKRKPDDPTGYDAFLRSRPQLPFLVAPKEGAGGDGKPRLMFADNGLTSPKRGSVCYAGPQLRMYVAAAIHGFARDPGGMDFTRPLPRLTVNALSRWGLGRKEPSVTHHSGRVFDLWAEAFADEGKKPAELHLDVWEGTGVTEAPGADAKLNAKFAAADHRLPERHQRAPQKVLCISLEEFKQNVLKKAWDEYFKELDERLGASPPPIGPPLERGLSVLAGTPDHADLLKRRWLHRSLVAIVLTFPELVIFAGQMPLMSVLAALEEAGFARAALPEPTAAAPGPAGSTEKESRRQRSGRGADKRKRDATRENPLATWLRAAKLRGRKCISFDKPEIHNHHQHVVYPKGAPTERELAFWAWLGVDFKPFLDAVLAAERDQTIVQASDKASRDELRELASMAAATAVDGRGRLLLESLLDPADAYPGPSTVIGTTGFLAVRDRFQELAESTRAITLPVDSATIRRRTTEHGPEFADPTPMAPLEPKEASLRASMVFEEWIKELANGDAVAPQAVSAAERQKAVDELLACEPVTQLLGRVCLGATIAAETHGVPRISLNDLLAQLVPNAPALTPFAWTIQTVKKKQSIIGWQWAPAPRTRKVPPYFAHRTHLNATLLSGGAANDAIQFQLRPGATIEITRQPNWSSLIGRVLAADKSEMPERAAAVGATLGALIAEAKPAPSGGHFAEEARQLPMLLLVARWYLASMGRADVISHFASTFEDRFEFRH